MDASSSSSPTDPRAEARETMSERKAKRRRIASAADDRPPSSRWRNPCEQRIYFYNLLHALRRDRRSSSSSSSSSNGITARRSRAVRESADSVLATAARGRTRWSRAILHAHRRALRIKSAKRKPRMPGRTRRAGRVKGGGVALDRKAKLLGRLVPGCGKLSFPTLLEETTDYISALEMQVRAMSALAKVLSSAGARDQPVAGGDGDSSLS